MKFTYFIGRGIKGRPRNNNFEYGSHARLFKEFLDEDEDFVEDTKNNIVDFSNRFHKSRIKNAIGFSFYIGVKDKLERIFPKRYIPEHFKIGQENDGNIWFVKPINGSCGKHITITKDPKDWLKKLGRRRVVIQKQIIPKLIRSRVWTLRQYIILFKKKDEITLWIHKNGSIKLGIEAYSEDYYTKDMLITNSDWKDQREKERKIIPASSIGFPFKRYKNYEYLFKNLIEMYKEVYKSILNNFKKQKNNPKIMEKIRNIGLERNKYAYHFIGVDLMFDSNGNPYIIEMNDGAQLNYKSGVYKEFNCREQNGEEWRKKMLNDIFINFIKRPLMELEPIESEFKRI